jgi:hypothetical protein
MIHLHVLVQLEGTGSLFFNGATHGAWFACVHGCGSHFCGSLFETWCGLTAMVRWTLMVLLNGRGSLLMDGSSKRSWFDSFSWCSYSRMSHFWSMAQLEISGSIFGGWCYFRTMAHFLVLVLLTELGSRSFTGASFSNWFVPLLGYDFGRVTHSLPRVRLGPNGSLFVTGTTQTKGFTLLHWCCFTEKVLFILVVRLALFGSLLINGTYFHT